MRAVYCGVVFLIICLWACVPNSVALYEKYPPFGLKAWKDRMLEASPINNPEEEGEFRDKAITISWVTKAPELSDIEIRCKKLLVERIELPGGREWAACLGGIYYEDLDRNGLSDIVIVPTWYGSGLGAFYKTTIIYFQQEPGKFRRLEFASLYFEISDFVSFSKNGKLDLLMMQLAQLECSDGKTHSFWVYVPYAIKDFNLVVDKKLNPEFPKFIWFSEKANNKPTDKLSQKEKNKYLDTLLALIESVPVPQ